ncbi:MAG: ribulokinase [Planctomycetota bacterium]
MPEYAIGLDYGTNSARAIVVDVATGEEIVSAVADYPGGTDGVLLGDDPNLARQDPRDYITTAATALREALQRAVADRPGFSPADVVGLGVDTTGSTPLPVDAEGTPLGLKPEFRKNLAAMAWLWKDHTAIAEAEEITDLASQMRPEYLAKCGGTYSSEWFFAKILHCLRTSPAVFEATHTWVELADWIPAMLTGTEHPEGLVVNVCAAGHKAMYNDDWDGYPDAEFLGKLAPELAELRSRLKDRAVTIGHVVGGLTGDWADRTGLRAGIPVSAGAFDAHLGSVGAGIRPGTLVHTIGTSGCHMLVAPKDTDVPDIPGLCGIVPGSILPDMIGLEAGQSAVGDIYNWLVNVVRPCGDSGPLDHAELTERAARLAPGASGLLALDWNNGNRTILVDQRLTGLLLGQTLHTTPAEIYRALIEATAFGTLTIVERFEEYGLHVEDLINIGGIAEKNPLVMQIYADVLGRPMKIGQSSQACALGAAMAGAVAAGTHESFAAAQAAMSGVKDIAYYPNAAAHAVYRELYGLYRTLHDAFGTTKQAGSLHGVMKQLLEIRARARTP